MSSYEEKVEKWTELYYGSLVGLTCIGVEANTDEEGSCWPALIFDIPENLGGGTAKIEVSCDEEGNRPGFLFGLPIVPDDINPFLVD